VDWGEKKRAQREEGREKTGGKEVGAELTRQGSG